MKHLKPWRTLGLITTGVTLAVIGLQWSGMLQLLEWALLNQWVRLRPLENRTVPIVLVTISDTDIQLAKRLPLSDQQLAALINRLKQHHPAVIGVDLYRDLPVEPGHAELLQVYASTPNLIGITKAVGNAGGPVVPPPPVLRDRNQFGVNDLLLDGDGILRRNLLSIQQNAKETLGLGTKLALLYLQQKGITPQGGTNGSCVRLGKAEFCRLQPNAGGYVRADTGGYQTLANFLRIPGGIPSVSFTAVMRNRVPNACLRDKIVLIGIDAETVWGDRFYTPYTTSSTNTWAGVEIHANTAAQIISSAVDGRPLLRGIPELCEWAWIFLWAGAGTFLGWSLISVRWALVLIPGSVVSILAIAYGLFLLGWWVIVVSPLLAFVGAGLVSRSYWVWQTLKQANQTLELKVRERTQELLEKNLALEQARQVAETAKQALERIARTDELTQVANRRFFNEYLNQEWHQLMQAKAPLSLILIDIDCFKLYNDTYGHLAGDACLAKVAAGLRAAANRPNDLVARYGGEEFAVILPNLPLPDATQVATAIQTTIRQLQIPHHTSRVTPYVTLSIGVAGIVPTAQTLPEQLIRKADEALYQAKTEGRDRVVIGELW